MGRITGNLMESAAIPAIISVTEVEDSEVLMVDEDTAAAHVTPHDKFPMTLAGELRIQLEQ